MSYRYLGNKTKISNQIADIVAQHVPIGASVADPMCGTASMSVAFRDYGYRVIASDIMTFAAQHAKVRLQIASEPGFEALGMSYVDVLRHLNSLPGERGFFWNEYAPSGRPRAIVPARSYFSTENAAKIDGMRSQLLAWAPLLTELESALLHHDLVLAANRVANIAGTYGHFRSKWSPSSIKTIELLPSKLDATSPEEHTVLQGPIEELAPDITADACYLDPPYKKRQYAANYHILETLARGDHPDAVGISGLRNWWDQYSDFCSKRKITTAFAEVFERMDCDLFFVSYSEDGLLAPDEMLSMFSKFGETQRLEFPHKRFKSNAGGAGGTLMEHLYVVRTG